MPGHRRDDQNLRVIAADAPMEIQKAAERLFNNNLFYDFDGLAIDFCFMKFKIGPSKTACNPLHHFRTGAQSAAKLRIGQRIPGVLKHRPRDLRLYAYRGQKRMLHIVEMVKHPPLSLP